MVITIFVSLYTTRLILGSLGAADFGIFNVVGGAIAMLGFLNSTMANATQRFMSYAEGAGKIEKKRVVFNVSLILHLAIALVTLLLLYFAMYPLFNGVFNIQPERVNAAKVVYCCLIFSTILTIINVPYDAVMTSHENMLYYSIIGIFEAILRLFVAFACVYSSRDKLIIYGVLMACIPLITLTIMKFYCHRHYEECVISPRRYWDWTMVKQIAGFFGWNFMTAISSLFSAQGIGIVLNHFFGTILNAAQGIAQQVNGALSNFSGNMMKALNPVITKSAGSQNIETMHRATLVGCKYSAMMTMFFGIPLSLEINYVLSIWLKDVPEWAAIFVILQILQSVVVQMADSAAISVYAQGNIKLYAIWKSIMNALPVVLVWLAYSIGKGPVWLYIPMIIVYGVCGDIVIIHFAHKKCGLRISDYLRKVMVPLFGVFVFMLAFGCLPIFLIREGPLRLVTTCLATTLGFLMASIVFAIPKEEKDQFVSFVKGFFGRIKKTK